MVRTLSQNKRMGVLETPLGADVLNLVRFDGTEGMSELFEFRVEALSEKANLDFDKAIGQNCSVTLNTLKGKKRHFNGVLVEAQWIGMRDSYHAYRLVLRPWLWLLTQTNDCKIFHTKTALEIIKSVFSDAGFTDFEQKTNGSYEPIPYCVQYRESKFAFVSRMMEEEGIYYYFEHTKDKHKLVLADSKSSHKALEGGSAIPFLPHGEHGVGEEERLWSWMAERRFRTGKITYRDYDYNKPNSTEMTVDAVATAKYTKSKLELYDYPGRYTAPGTGKKLAKVRLESKQALDKRRYASGEAPRFFPGAVFTLDRHAEQDENKEYLILRATHSYTGQDYRATGLLPEIQPYRGSYEVLESSIPFKAAATTPKPMVYGPQTAKVVGKGEIDVDSLGRILVKFHWDRDGNGQSCRVRIGQVWAGKGWGGIFIPRVGMEVIVEFLEGDPDQPLVTGAVYNADKTVPYSLPDQKTIAGIKSESTEKGPGAYNEFKFEDKKGSEKITKRAEKDMDVFVRHQEVREVGETFGGGTARSTKIINGDDKRVVIKGDDLLNVDAGHQKIKVAQTITIDAGMKITLVCGGSKITMDPGSIKIESPMITIAAGATLEAKSPMTTVKGDGMLTLKGGVIMIN